MGGINFLKETIAVIESNDAAVSDVQWVGSSNGGYLATWEHFAELADFDYDGGFGAAKIAEDLIVAAANWWLERHEYDGSEWWEFKTIPKRPENGAEIKLLSVYPVEAIGWKNLAELHERAKAKA